MSYRGRLIWPVQARIARLDTAATEVNAIGGQPSGYNRIFREPVTDATGADSRVYMPETLVNCQARSKKFGEVMMLPAGRELDFDFRTVLHYQELEDAGLIGADGSVVFQPSDKLLSIYRTDGVTLLHDFTDTPLFLVHVADRSFGLSGLTRNLARLYWSNRRQGNV